MISRKVKFSVIIQLTFLFYSSTISNPLETTPFSEIQIIDLTHFIIEYDCYFEFPTPYPEQLDSIFLFLGFNNYPAPRDSFIVSTSTIEVNSAGIALITEKHFPDITLTPGKTLYLGHKNLLFSPGITITDTFSTNTSFISGYNESTVYYCWDEENCFKEIAKTLVYIHNDNPSLGIRNATSISSMIPKKPVETIPTGRFLSASVSKGIVISLGKTTVSQGTVQIYSINGKLVRKLPFETHGGGTYTINWDGKNDNNQVVSFGRYTLCLLVGTEFLCAGMLSF